MNAKKQKPTEFLKKEHKIIRDIVRILEACAKKIETGEKMDMDILKGSISLINNFTHKYHRRKEETVLFKIAERKKILWGLSNMNVLLHEHEEGSEYVRKLAAMLNQAVSGGIEDKKAKKAVLKAIYGYSTLLNSHILEEERRIYPVIENVLSPQEQENIIKGFDRLEEEMIKVGDKERYENLIKDYKKRLGI